MPPNEILDLKQFLVSLVVWLVCLCLTSLFFFSVSLWNAFDNGWLVQRTKHLDLLNRCVSWSEMVRNGSWIVVVVVTSDFTTQWKHLNISFNPFKKMLSCNWGIALMCPPNSICSDCCFWCSVTVVVPCFANVINFYYTPKTFQCFIISFEHFLLLFFFFCLFFLLILRDNFSVIFFLLYELSRAN